MIRIVATILCTMTACMLAFLGWHWVTIGWGLNPLAAWPLASLFLVAPIAAYWDED